MSEIRFTINGLLEEKLTSIMEKMKFSTKKEAIEFLINKQFQSDMEGSGKNGKK